MKPSVVIITKNESAHIAGCIASARQVSEDIIVADTGSTDDTVAIAQKENVKVVSIPWKNYGDARNHGAAAASHEWILSIDADERISGGMAAAIRELRDDEPDTIFSFRRRSFYRSRQVRFGSWGFDKVGRLYHKGLHKWDEWPVHEKLVLHASSRKKRIGGKILHFPVCTETEMKEKNKRYAELAARKYMLQRNRPSLVRQLLAPVVAFLQSYIFYFGFLDGFAGFSIARLNAVYTFQKYAYLSILQSPQRNSTVDFRPRILSAAKGNG